MENAFLIAAIAGVTELAKYVKAKQYDKVATIVAAFVIGGVAGALQLAGLPGIEAGVVAAASAVGVYAIAKVV